MVVKGKKQVKGKWNFLLMRPQGEVTNFAISPLLLAVALLFALLFTAAGILAINMYFSLYLDYHELAESRREALARLNQLDGQYKYQISLAQDYAALLNELNGPEQGAWAEGAGPGAAVEVPAAGPDTPEGGESQPAEAAPLPEEEDPLEAWADRLPVVSGQAEERLQIVDFRVDGNRFNFQLVNESQGGILARGRLLTLFLVEADGQRQAVPFPDFDPRSSEPDFEPGPSYNIRSSKQIFGQLRAPAGCEILAMMVVAQSSDGRIVMKRRILP